MKRRLDWALIVRCAISGWWIYEAAFNGSKAALALVLGLTVLSCEALAYSVHGRKRTSA